MRSSTASSLTKSFSSMNYGTGYQWLYRALISETLRKGMHNQIRNSRFPETWGLKSGGDEAV